MITLTFTPMSDEADDWLVIEAWFLGARVAKVEEYACGFERLDMEGFDTPETLEKMTVLAQPIIDNLRKHFKEHTMHGLNTIYSLNEEAARFDYDRKLRDLRNEGLVVVWKQDDLGLCDITVPPLGFETVVEAQQALLGRKGNWQILK